MTAITLPGAADSLPHSGVRARGADRIALVRSGHRVVYYPP